MTNRKITKLAGLIVFFNLILGPSASAITLTANFDSFSEDIYGRSFIDGDIRFFEWLSSPDSTTRSRFSIETTSRDLGDAFSPPNLLGAGGFVSGPGGTISLSQLSSVRIRPSRRGISIDLEVFRSSRFLAFSPNNVLTLDAFLDEELVASDMALNTEFLEVSNGILHRTFSLNNIEFDELRLSSSGPDDQGVSFIALDNVEVKSIPEPLTILGAVTAASAGTIFKRQLTRRRKACSKS